MALLNFVGFWVIGISCGSTLAFETDVGVAGLWWGLALGLTCTAVLGLVLLLRTDWDDQVQLALHRVRAEDANKDSEPGTQLARADTATRLDDCLVPAPVVETQVLAPSNQTLQPTLYNANPQPYILVQSSPASTTPGAYTLHPMPSTLSPAPYTLHSLLYTVHAVG